MLATTGRYRYSIYVLAVIAMSAASIAYAQDRGDCSENRWSQLNDAVSYNCKGTGRGSSCNIGMSCSDLATNRDKFLACGKARNQMMQECYKGGDPNHELASDDAFAAANRCIEIFKNPDHKPPCS